MCDVRVGPVRVDVAHRAPFATGLVFRKVTRVHLVRHGRTASNRGRRTMGWLDVGIEPDWVRAAAAVADVPVREPVDWVVSSPLARGRSSDLDSALARRYARAVCQRGGVTTTRRPPCHWTTPTR